MSSINIFIDMAKKEFEQYLSRRIMTEDGWVYFCRGCGQYHPETEFYHSKKSKWGIDSRCKIHYKKTKEELDPEMDYLKLDALSENDFIETQKFLERLGYKFGPGQPSVHSQFMERVKNKKDKKNGTN